MLLQMQKSNGQNGGFHSEYPKLNRFLSIINLNKNSIEVYQSFSFIYFFVHYRWILVYRPTYDI
jgi:hypothetical protein